VAHGLFPWHQWPERRLWRAAAVAARGNSKGDGEGGSEVRARVGQTSRPKKATHVPHTQRPQLRQWWRRRLKVNGDLQSSQCVAWKTINTQCKIKITRLRLVLTQNACARLRSLFISTPSTPDILPQRWASMRTCRPPQVPCSRRGPCCLRSTPVRPRSS